MKNEKLKQHLISIYKRHDFELRANKEKVLDATMEEVSDLIEYVITQIQNQVNQK